MVKERMQKTDIQYPVRLFALFLCIFLALFGSYAHADDEDSLRLNDWAGIFTSAEKAEMLERIEDLEETYQMNYLAVTIDDDYDMTASEFAESFYEVNDYEERYEKGGIVLLIDLYNRELNLATTGDMIYYITDQREEQIYDAGYGYASEGEYGEAMLAMLERVQDYMKEGVPAGQYTYDTETGRIVRYKSLTTFDWMIALGVPFLTAAAVCLILYFQYSKVREYQYSVGQNADIRVTDRQDRLVNQFVTKRRIQRDPPNGGPGGGRGGGGRTSTHSSGGGGTYGGGHGRSF